MTLTQTANQLYDLSVDGHFNMTTFTRKQFVNAVKSWMSKPETLYIPNHYVLIVELPDGVWNCYIEYLPDLGEYDYYIPDTREQEKALQDAFYIR